MLQVRWCVGGARLLTQIICWTLNAAQFKIKKQICWFSVMGDLKCSVDSDYSEGDFKENLMMLISY